MCPRQPAESRSCCRKSRPTRTRRSLSWKSRDRCTSRNSEQPHSLSRNSQPRQRAKASNRPEGKINTMTIDARGCRQSDCRNSFEVGTICARLGTKLGVSAACGSSFDKRCVLALHRGPFRPSRSRNGRRRSDIRAGLEELGMPLPSRAEAAWLIARSCMESILSNSDSPYRTLGLLKDASQAATEILPDREYVGSGLDLRSLIGIYYSYGEPTANYYKPERRIIADERERQAILDRDARREAKEWLDRHPG